jgi:dihydrofolate synthase/folylpolyglutamate synthase
LADKDIVGIVRPLREHFSIWNLAGLDAATARGLTATDLRSRLASFSEISTLEHTDVAQALKSAVSAANPDDRVIVFGSFFVAAAALEQINRMQSE